MLLVDSGSQDKNRDTVGRLPEWPEINHLSGIAETEQQRLGYLHTLREILQQPATWRVTGRQLQEIAGQLQSSIRPMQSIVLTGSGSSEFVGECVRPVVRSGLGIAAQVVGSGSLLTHGVSLLPPQRPALMVSFARSGDSPESVGALSFVKDLDSSIEHLVITCNRDGQLAQRYKDDDHVMVLVLDEKTNDRSLVMTSSFTNMALAGISLGMLDREGAFAALTEKLADAGEEILRKAFGSLQQLGSKPFKRAFYLASPSLAGVARESALKMLEMTSGRAMTVDMTYLALRHGPMSGVTPESLVVCFLSSDPLVRAYECDVIRELNQKGLGLCKLIVGRDVPSDLMKQGDISLDHKGFEEDQLCGVLYLLVGQVLAFYRCMQEGLRPDEPSNDGVINRVVQHFKLYSGVSQAL